MWRSLLALGSRPEVEVHLFVTNPCRYYWGFARSQDPGAPRKQAQARHGSETLQGPANPLLASMGKLGRDYLHQLMELEVPQIEAFVDIEDRDDEGKVTLLRAIQKDVLELAERGLASSVSMPAITRALSAWMTAPCRSTPATAPCGSSRCCTTGCWPCSSRIPPLTPKTWW